ncbi:uncharacterized protein NECHADRAFT_82281 [Fusarium vanettenii 77-13-4]|uniref:Extracellular membrane protein CFEM domain-containing protein n=1 Tax=Fusarium vanettenii (strain ATCC MYA-4622 / CBS 123669 / FGSC 9596 / NRRL 45880 / 77-13-4) TaxID=660122 RepID=C7ZNF5_FUSV7|nr:uncharacterized protein NECHADRAFT_82281 [Fusarium vanettenii 77-13-4]EEU34450.1 hypothetical protein NECHADRAFT_82281 [Fusarium vanettenii 77-13-4]
MVQTHRLTLLGFAVLATAVDVSLKSTGCADAAGFESCQTSANKKTTSCINQAHRDDSQQEILACGCQDYVNNYNCYAAFCWNKVWECDYQEYIVSYLQNCPIAKLPVPYFPAPKQAPSSCSCNLGKVYLAIHDAIQQTETCSDNSDSADAGSNLQRMQGCSCCEISGALSRQARIHSELQTLLTLASIVEICPDTAPKYAGLAEISQLETQLNVQFDTCEKYMDTYDCHSDLSFSLDGVSTFYKPDDSLKTGTATLSNGPGTVTAPASGHIFTYTNGGDGVVYTITAAADKASSGSKGDSSGSKSTSIPNESSSESKGKATESSSKSAGVMLETGNCLVLGAILVSILAVW